VRAYDQAMIAPENSAQGFKRLMGTATPIHFAAADVDLTPEDASAELLRAMTGYALVEAGADEVTGAVVAIPAAFNQMQSEATLEAAHEAGLTRVALLQEPVAAAMAAMAGAAQRSGRFLVYDLGGGTFDLALVQATGGTVNVVAHEGVNMLGGRDFDRLILDKLVRPWLAATFDLPDDFTADRRYDRLVRVARLAAERAKIDLSTRAETTIHVGDDIVRLNDSRSEPIYLDAPITRQVLDELVAPKVAQSIALCRKIVGDAGYALSDIDQVVLIGGPTKMPLIRARIQAELGIAVEDVKRVDPMTAVAVGAAIYCESRAWSDTGSAAKQTRAQVQAGAALVVAYDFEQRTANTRARLRISRTAGEAGATVQVESTYGWSSGRLSLDGPVELSLDLPDAGLNRFRALVFDAQGRPVADASRTLEIERTYASAAGAPATQTLGVKVRDQAGRNTIETLVAKGTLLPQSGTARFRAAEPLRATDPGQLMLELFQVNDPLVLAPELNLHVGAFRIRGSDLPSDLAIRRGDEVMVHWTVSEGQTLSAEVEIPSVGQSFDEANFFNWQTASHSFDGEEGAKLADEMLTEAEDDMVEAEESLPGSLRLLLTPLRARLDAQREMLRGSFEPDARRGATEEARLVRQAIATVCAHPDARGAVLQRRLSEQLRFYDRDVRDRSGAGANARADELRRNGRARIEAADPQSLDLADRIIDQLNALYWSEGLLQPAFCAQYWRWRREERHLARDKAAFDATVRRGDAALAADDMGQLRKALFELFDNRISRSRQNDVAALADILRA